MDQLRFFYKVTRPPGVASGFLATWAAATICAAPLDLKLSASATMALSVLASSLFHYGAANRMYARKVWDVIEIQQPKLLIGSGILIFSFAMIFSDMFLPRGAALLTWFNAVAVALYGIELSRRWYTKNITMALVCTTPVVMGWMVGTITHPSITYLAPLVFFAHYGREVIKDVQDREANCGIRVTLPLRFTPEDAQRIGSALIAASAMLAFMLAAFSPLALVVGVALAMIAAWLMLKPGATGRTPSLLTGILFVLIAAFL